MLSKTPLTQHKAQAANCRCKTELYNFPFLWLAVGFYYYCSKIFKVKKPPAVLWCKEQGRCTHPLHPDLCQTGSTDAPRCPISLCILTICLLKTSQCNTIVFLGEGPFSIMFLSSATLAELLPLDLPPPPSQRSCFIYQQELPKDLLLLGHLRNSMSAKKSGVNICLELCNHNYTNRARLPFILSPLPFTCASVEKALLQRSEMSLGFSIHFF